MTQLAGIEISWWLSSNMKFKDEEIIKHIDFPTVTKRAAVQVNEENVENNANQKERDVKSTVDEII